MVIWRSKQSKQSNIFWKVFNWFPNKLCFGLILFEIISHQFILQFRLKYAQKMPILCARTYEILSKQFKNESCVNEWVCVWSSMMQLFQVKWEMGVETISSCCGAGEFVHRRWAEGLQRTETIHSWWICVNRSQKHLANVNRMQQFTWEWLYLIHEEAWLTALW